MTAQTLSLTSPSVGESESTTILHGVRLWLLRAVWWLVLVASLVLAAALFPVILRSVGYGDWTIEQSAAFFGINIFSRAFDTYALVLLSLKYLVLAFFVGTAVFIYWNKSNDWMALLVSLMLLTLPHALNLGGFADSSAWRFYRYPWYEIFGTMDQLFDGVGLALLFLVMLLFPDGRFVPRWTRWIAIAVFLVVLTIWFGSFLDNLLPDNTSAWLTLVAIFFTLLLASVWSQIYRYRSVSSRAQQAQTRIVVLSIVTIAGILLLVALVSIGGIEWMDASLGAVISFVLLLIAPALLPLAFAVAILRHRLWQSERVLNRALIYGALTVILLLVYVLIVAALSELFRAVNDFFIAAIATAVVALLFQPLRERLQRSINHFLYGERDDPFRVLNRLGAQMENTLTPDAALPLIVETISKTLRVPFVAIRLTMNPIPENSSVAPDSSQTLAAQFGTAQSNVESIPLRYQNETLGDLLIARRAPNEKFSSADTQLLENLARQAGAVVYTARLNAQLRQSRERIIVEREQERKRLRRDLHDDLGPTLAAQTLKLDAALELLHGDDSANAGVRKILQDLKTQTQSTVTNIRRIVYELRPPALDDLGLIGALRANLAQSNGTNGLQITLDAADLPPLSAAVQVNAYRIVLEAVNNVIKHAHAEHCWVTLSACEHLLELTILDDGVGLPPDLTLGVGMNSMRERAEELGGTFNAKTNQPHGTQLRAQLPIQPL